MARASTYTLLSLDRFAQIIGLNPAHFNQCAAINLSTPVFNLTGSCSDVWFQYDWQDGDRLSRESIARSIKAAEDEIARYLNYYPAPLWFTNEPHQYPRFARRSYYGNGRTINGQFKPIKTKWGRIVETGQRKNTLVGTPTISYSDPDGDGFSELATISQATTETDVNNIRLYFAGKSAADSWELRPVKTKSISGGTLTATLDSWLLVNPDLWEVLPTPEAPTLVDVSTTANFVTTLDVYQVTTDHTATSAQFYWQQEPNSYFINSNGVCTSCGGTGCETCSLNTQMGCAVVSDVQIGEVVPTPGTYSDDNGYWTKQSWTDCREPELVKLWYYAGDLSDEYLAGTSYDPLSDWWAYTIAYLAVAKLEKQVCSCNNVQYLVNDWMTDLAFSGQSGSYNVDFELLNNPFGTKKGAVMAWQRVSKFKEKLFEAAVI